MWDSEFIDSCRFAKEKKEGLIIEKRNERKILNQSIVSTAQELLLKIKIK